jgi:hypothetical protein
MGKSLNLYLEHLEKQNVIRLPDPTAPRDFSRVSG